jgi:outer membrane protein OmpA-like peptidoglycan-associated protein
MGAAGEQGAQGAGGFVGAAGPTGPSGPVGAQGRTGVVGAQGATLFGPTGPAGGEGASGMQGSRGETGSTGSSTQGYAGATGASGTAGLQGSVGPTGDQGSAGTVNRWTSYRLFNFDDGSASIRTSEMKQVSAITAYLAENPSLQLGIDGSVDANIVNRPDRDLDERRVNAVRNALMEAGTPASRIETGAFGDPRLRSEGRVQVLFITAR